MYGCAFSFELNFTTVIKYFRNLCMPLRYATWKRGRDQGPYCHCCGTQRFCDSPLNPGLKLFFGLHWNLENPPHPLCIQHAVLPFSFLPSTLRVALLSIPSACAKISPDSSRVRSVIVRLWFDSFWEITYFLLASRRTLFRLHVTATSLGETMHLNTASLPSSAMTLWRPLTNFTTLGPGVGRGGLVSLQENSGKN